MSQPTPKQRLAGLIGGYSLTQAIYVAAKLGIADWLHEGPQHADQLAKATGAHGRSLGRLLRTLVAAGIFTQDNEDRLGLTELSELLRSDVPGSLAAQAISVGETHYAAFGHLLHSVRTAAPGFDAAFGMPLFDHFAANGHAAHTFDAALADFRASAAAAMLEVYDLSGVTTLVDVGGGNGSLLSATLAEHPSMRGILFDLPHVVERAGADGSALGASDRCELVGGDFFESVPAGGDVYLLRHIIHDWNDEKAGRILENCRRATGGAGKLLLVESIIRPGNAPSLAKSLDLTMLAVTGGMERTEDEYRELLETSGFRLARVVPAPFEIDVIEAVPV